MIRPQLNNSIPVLEWRVPLGTGDRPNPRRRRLRLRLLESRRIATLHIVLSEICMMLRRTAGPLRNTTKPALSRLPCASEKNKGTAKWLLGQIAACVGSGVWIERRL